MRRLVLASSAAVFGPANHAHAEDDPVDPIDIYGLSKLFAEKLVDRFHRDTGVPCYIARLFNVYGPGDTTPHLIPEVVQQLAEDNVLQLGNMNTYRDFIHVTDVARALTLFLPPIKADFEVFNIGSGSVYSPADVVEMAQSIMGRPIRVESRGERLRPVDRPFLQADVRKMGKVFGWTSQVQFRDGLADLLRSHATAAPNPAADARRPPK
jgi:UDP-glucose 4-epimerase